MKTFFKCPFAMVNKSALSQQALAIFFISKFIETDLWVGSSFNHSGVLILLYFIFYFFGCTLVREKEVGPAGPPAAIILAFMTMKSNNKQRKHCKN